MNDNTLKLDLSKIYNSEIGSHENFQVSGKLDSDEEINYIEPVKISVDITKLDNGLMAEGNITTKISLICHRCAKSFEKKINIEFNNYLSENSDDEYVIGEDLSYDFSIIAKDEIILSLGIQTLCSEKCNGIIK